jgi:hypothetical protein
VPDRTYTVNVNNVVVNGTPRSFTYDVTVLDPFLPPPFTCTPRPRPTMSVVRTGTGQIQATVKVTGENTLTALRFGVPGRAITNATVNVAGVAAGVANGQTVNLAPGTTQAVVAVTRLSPSAATVPFVVVDRCGDWQTFTGMGPGFP